MSPISKVSPSAETASALSVAVLPVALACSWEHATTVPAAACWSARIERLQAEIELPDQAGRRRPDRRRGGYRN
ncbi:MAG: hypothetical protein H7A53_10700 [Akkermansiaceae bacterium]|nr:hypothetical protein [Akkermansiaceae bacterium]